MPHEPNRTPSLYNNVNACPGSSLGFPPRIEILVSFVHSTLVLKFTKHCLSNKIREK